VAVYSIGDLEKLSGIKAHTIRIWEKRYNLLTPKRTESNIRFYEDGDLKQLMNVAILKKQGMRISEIAALSNREVKQEVRKANQKNIGGHPQIDALTLAMIEFDQSHFDELMDQYIESMGFEKCMLKVIYPLLNKLSILWMTGSIRPVQEQFMSLMIRNRIISANNYLPPPASDTTFLLFLPKNENQEISMLFFQHILKARSKRAINIGSINSLDELKDACDIAKPNFLFTMINQDPEDMTAQAYLKKLSEFIPNGQICVTGYQLAHADYLDEDHIIYLNSLQDAIHFIESMAVQSHH
jgi:DNA-binding transcriptional MerR regulator